MTIADDYRNAADWVAGYAFRSEPIPPHTAGRLATVLLDLADLVEKLERVTFMPPPVYAACERDGDGC